MTFGATTFSDHEFAQLAPTEQMLAKAFAAELGQAARATIPARSPQTDAGIELGLSNLGGTIRLDLE